MLMRESGVQRAGPADRPRGGQSPEQAAEPVKVNITLTMGRIPPHPAAVNRGRRNARRLAREARSAI